MSEYIDVRVEEYEALKAEVARFDELNDDYLALKATNEALRAKNKRLLAHIRGEAKLDPGMGYD